MDTLRIGTCSWKYESWEGLVYSSRKPANYLEEYSQQYNSVEVDQWFWSLFAGDTVVLPKKHVVEDYAASVPEDFTFGVKIPNSITLTHHYKKKKSSPLEANPYYLSTEVMLRFLDSIKPLYPNLGPLMIQFEYLNKQKMPGGLSQFVNEFGEFVESLPTGFNFCVEIRNPHFLKDQYFDFLLEAGLHHVFLQGYYMPSIFDTYRQHSEQIQEMTVIRLHGPDRKGIEQQTGKNWNQIVAPRDDDLAKLKLMLPHLAERNVQSFVFVNNHFEGSAPRTIERIKNL